MDWMGRWWDGVGRTDVSRRRNGSATVNRTYNVNVPKKKSQKNADTNIEDCVRYKAE